MIFWYLEWLEYVHWETRWKRWHARRGIADTQPIATFAEWLDMVYEQEYHKEQPESVREGMARI